MTIPIANYDYILPKENIAQIPLKPRESARLMVVSKKDGSIIHRRVSDLPEYFSGNDCIIINNTKVFKARLYGYTHNSDGTHGKVEIFLIRPLRENAWHALGQPGKKLTSGKTIHFAQNFSATVTKKYSDGSLEISFQLDESSVIAKANQHGHVPVPHYIKHEPNLSEYQTSYAKIIGSVAAPTAGFHMTKKIRNQIKKNGTRICEITLHVGIGTFQPIKSDTIDNHNMHSEWSIINAETASAINTAKQDGKRIVAIGTTSVRSLEGNAIMHGGILSEYSGDINLFIKPGFRFRIVDAILTNFHLPKSTLLVLVSTFAGHDLIMRAYKEAVREKYRFYSFGDAMLII